MVTILIPAYNVKAFLPDCLDSVLGQTYTNLQVVIIDDGSTDDTWRIMQEYAVKDSRIEIYHQENQGVAKTRNALLEKIKGEYVLFVDADDWIESDMVEYLENTAESYNCGMVTCYRVKSVYPVKKILPTEEIWDQSRVIYEFLHHDAFIGMLGNKLIKTNLLRNCKFHSDISYGEDALFCWNVLQRVDKIVATDKVLYHYRLNEGSISHAPYDGKRISGHIVWEIIARESKEKWPKYANIAEANYAISDMWQIYYAAQSRYPFDENIRLFQQNVRSHLPMIYRSGLVNLKKMIFATVAAYSYKACWALTK